MTQYRARAPDAVLVVPLDELAAVYHRPSGATHLVEPLVPELIAALGQDWSEPGAVLDRLAARFELPDADTAVLTARLDELAVAGLIEAG